MTVRERPILLSGECVRATLAGRKTQTRRPVRPLDPDQWGFIDEYDDAPWPLHHDKYGDFHRRPCPYGEVGDRLWVRETWGLVFPYTDWETGIIEEVEDWMRPIPESRPHRPWRVWYRADDRNWDPTVEDRGFRWRPSIHMPRWASRLTLTVADVRVERVQDATGEDIHAEGIHAIRIPMFGEVVTVFGHDDPAASACSEVPSEAFRRTWDAFYAKRGAAWDANPWTWVVSFDVEVKR